MEAIINTNWFSVIIGIIIGSAINHVFWLVQYKRQIKQQFRSERLKRIDEICDFCSILVEKSKAVYGLTVTGQAKEYFFNEQNFWSSVPFYKTRMIVFFYFPKCIEKFDELQIAISELVKLMQKSMAQEEITYNELDFAVNNITKKINHFQNILTKIYSKELSLY